MRKWQELGDLLKSGGMYDPDFLNDYIDGYLEGIQDSIDDGITLQQTREAIDSLRARLAALLPSVRPTEQPPVCRVCGGSGFVAQKQCIDDGYGEVDSCHACDDPLPSVRNGGELKMKEES